MNLKWWTLYKLVKTAEAKCYFVTRKEELGYFLDTFMGAALYFCLVFDEKRGKEYWKTFCNFFYVLLGLFCFWREEWYNMLWDVKLDIFWRLNLSLILLFSILESKYESAQMLCLQGLVDSRRHLLQCLFLHGYVHVLLYKNGLKRKMYLYPVANLAVKSGVSSY